MQRACLLSASAVAFLTLTAGVGCGAPPGSAAPEAVGTSVQAISASSILSRAQEWVSADLLYCQSPNGASDPDPACPSVCSRESNPAWDPYRSDCSGFVSWAWGLPAPGRTTDEFAPADTTVSYVINGIDLQPGDALNIPADHMVLFVGWVTMGTEATFEEEPGCSASPPYAHSFNSTVTLSGSDVYIDYEGATFTAIRFTGVSGSADGGASGADAAASCTVTTTGMTGDCIDTTACAAMGGTSTPDYCPGPANIQCCTGVPASSPVDAGGTDAGSSPPSPDAAVPLDGGGPTSRDAGSAPSGEDGGAKDDASGSSGGGDAPPTGAPNRYPNGCAASSSGLGASDGPAPLAIASLALVVFGRRRRVPSSRRGHGC